MAATMKRKVRTGKTSALNVKVLKVLSDGEKHNLEGIFPKVKNLIPADYAVQVYRKANEGSKKALKQPKEVQVKKGMKRAVILALLWFKRAGLTANSKPEEGRGWERQYWLTPKGRKYVEGRFGVKVS